jgi:hypothetical protein
MAFIWIVNDGRYPGIKLCWTGLAVSGVAVQVIPFFVPVIFMMGTWRVGNSTGDGRIPGPAGKPYRTPYLRAVVRQACAFHSNTFREKRTPVFRPFARILGQYSGKHLIQNVLML